VVCSEPGTCWALDASKSTAQVQKRHTPPPPKKLYTTLTSLPARSTHWTSCEKINRSHTHTHTHTHRQRTTPPTPTHTRTRREQHPKRTSHVVCSEPDTCWALDASKTTAQVRRRHLPLPKNRCSITKTEETDLRILLPVSGCGVQRARHVLGPRRWIQTTVQVNSHRAVYLLAYLPPPPKLKNPNFFLKHNCPTIICIASPVPAGPSTPPKTTAQVNIFPPFQLFINIKFTHPPKLKKLNFP